MNADGEFRFQDSKTNAKTNNGAAMIDDRARLEIMLAWRKRYALRLATASAARG